MIVMMIVMMTRNVEEVLTDKQRLTVMAEQHWKNETEEFYTNTIKKIADVFCVSRISKGFGNQ